jgi:Domain of unknown function (DUF4192)
MRGYLAAPAALLVLCACQNGDEPADVALDPALGDNPRYSMALLLRQAAATTQRNACAYSPALGGIYQA